MSGFLASALAFIALAILVGYVAVTTLLVLLFARGPRGAAAAHGVAVVGLLAYAGMEIYGIETRPRPNLAAKLTIARWWLSREEGHDALHVEVITQFTGVLTMDRFLATASGAVVLEGRQLGSSSVVTGERTELSMPLARRSEVAARHYELTITLRAEPEGLAQVTYGTDYPLKLPAPWIPGEP